MKNSSRNRKSPYIICKNIFSNCCNFLLVYLIYFVVFFIKLELCVGEKTNFTNFSHRIIWLFMEREEKNAGVYKGKKNWPIIVGK